MMRLALQRIGDASELLRILRFGANGLFNTALSYVLFLLLLRMGLPVFVALLLSTVTAIACNFQTSRRLVFQSKQSGLMLRFFSVYVLLFAINYLSLLALKSCGLPSWLAQASVVLPIAALAYTAQRNFVFTQTRA